MITKLFALFLILKLLTSHQTVNINNQVLAEDSMNLENRYPISAVNLVMKENILLALAYMSYPNLKVMSAPLVIKKPMHVEMRLHSGEVFAFHDKILPEYAKKVTVTGNAHFNSMEGFKSDGYLVGDGVCHLASLMYLTAHNAGLLVDAPTNHDFALIPDIPKKYGVSIYTSPFNHSGSARQNLYITNPYPEDIQLVIDARESLVTIKILKLLG